MYKQTEVRLNFREENLLFKYIMHTGHPQHTESVIQQFPYMYSHH